MAKFHIFSLCLLTVTILYHDVRADHHLTSSEQDYNNVKSYEVVGTGAISSSITDGNDNKQNTGLYSFRRQRRSPHIGFGGHGHYYRPAYVQHQPILGVAPVHGYYHGHPHSQQLTNSHSQAQAISASFGGGGHLLGGGGSGISAAAASAGSGTNNQHLLHHGYGRK